MESMKVDVAIIGAGTAGLNARRQVRKAGKECVLIERGPLGTTCARVGCMPSKLLIAAANAAHSVASADVFGIEVGQWNVNGAAVMKRVRQHRDRFVQGVVDGMDAEGVVRGEARFVGPNELRVGELAVQFETAVIATGAHSWIPPVLQDIATDVLTTEHIFELEELPASLAVFGTGVIAMELGQALHRLGVETHFFNPFDELLGVQDPQIDATARSIFGRSLNLHLGVENTTVVEKDGAYVVSWTEQGTQHQRSFERIFAAAGRRPNLAALDLHEAGVELNDRGHPKDWDSTTTRIGDSPLFLAGDVAQFRPLLHEASDEGVVAGRNAAMYPESAPQTRRTPMGIVFTDPNIAWIGARHNELEPDEFVCGEVSFHNQGRAKVNGEAHGKIRLYAGRDEALLGAELIAPDGEHLAHLLVSAVDRKATPQDLLRLPYYHPTLEEGLRTAIRNLARALEVDGGCPPQDLADGPAS